MNGLQKIMAAAVFGALLSGCGVMHGLTAVYSDPTDGPRAQLRTMGKGIRIFPGSDMACFTDPNAGYANPAFAELRAHQDLGMPKPSYKLGYYNEHYIPAGVPVTLNTFYEGPAHMREACGVELTFIPEQGKTYQVGQDYRVSSRWVSCGLGVTEVWMDPDKGYQSKPVPRVPTRQCEK
ncbi:hypothetical protein [Crenobacter cavernae]|uniref:Lipoprotein n=1 Tax=Crenobacter cavernae TaxID=2290923 RepID=A0A345Y3I4_9NEIS|nr:hypothetical protein [Crenobacter cavernae]AXK38486.1 hypothetical protein DWG20_03060 [Crenobacter cavernae]